jgi:hypothetical protein
VAAISDPAANPAVARMAQELMSSQAVVDTSQLPTAAATLSSNGQTQPAALRGSKDSNAAADAAAAALVASLLPPPEAPLVVDWAAVGDDVLALESLRQVHNYNNTLLQRGLHLYRRTSAFLC